MLVLKAQPNQWLTITHEGEILKIRLKKNKKGIHYLIDGPLSFDIGRVKIPLEEAPHWSL